jgi:hypothetical protein
MTDALHSTFSEAIARTEAHQQQQMWRAAQIVTAHVKVSQQRDDILECLGLTDVSRPE